MQDLDAALGRLRKGYRMRRGEERLGGVDNVGYILISIHNSNNC